MPGLSACFTSLPGDIRRQHGQRIGYEKLLIVFLMGTEHKKEERKGNKKKNGGREGRQQQKYKYLRKSAFFFLSRHVVLQIKDLNTFLQPAVYRGTAQQMRYIAKRDAQMELLAEISMLVKC